MTMSMETYDTTLSVTHKVAEDVQELDEVSNHLTIWDAFRIIEHDMSTSEASGFVDMLEGRMGWLRMRGSGEGGGSRARRLSSLICLPLVDIMPAATSESEYACVSCNMGGPGLQTGRGQIKESSKHSRNIGSRGVIRNGKGFRVFSLEPELRGRRTL